MIWMAVEMFILIWEQILVFKFVNYISHICTQMHPFSHSSEKFSAMFLTTFVPWVSKLIPPMTLISKSLSNSVASNIGECKSFDRLRLVPKRRMAPHFILNRRIIFPISGVPVFIKARTLVQSPFQPSTLFLTFEMSCSNEESLRRRRQRRHQKWWSKVISKVMIRLFWRIWSSKACIVPSIWYMPNISLHSFEIPFRFFRNCPHHVQRSWFISTMKLISIEDFLWRITNHFTPIVCSPSMSRNFIIHFFCMRHTCRERSSLLSGIYPLCLSHNSILSMDIVRRGDSRCSSLLARLLTVASFVYPSSDIMGFDGSLDQQRRRFSSHFKGSIVFSTNSVDTLAS